MAFNEAFWVAVAAAAPVIALATVVTLGDAEKNWRRIPERVMLDILHDKPHMRAYRQMYPVVLGALVTVYTVLVVEIVALLLALWSLLDRTSVVNPWLALILTVAGLVLLTAASVSVVGYGAALDEEERRA